MVPYVFLLGIPSLFAFISAISRKKAISIRIKSLELPTFFLIYILILSCRGIECGNDTIVYKLFFDQAKNIEWNDVFNTDLELGYALFQKAFVEIIYDYQWYLTFVAILSIVPIWRFYRNRCDLPYLTIVLFCTVAPFSMYFSGIRQVLAMAFAFNAFQYAKEKKRILFIATIIAASLFHRSAFIMLVMYPLFYLRITKKTVWFVLPVIGGVYVFNKSIFSFLTVFINDYYTADISSTGAYSVLILLIIFAIYVYLIPDERNLDDETNAMRNILLLCICIQCFAPINTLAMRMNYYFLSFIPVLLPRCAAKSKLEHKQITILSVVIMCVFFASYFFINLKSGAGLNIYPYEGFWS